MCKRELLRGEKNVGRRTKIFFIVMELLLQGKGEKAFGG